MTVNIEGTGGGEVKSVGEEGEAETWPGSPPIACAYSSPGPQTGVCEDEMSNEEGSFGVFMTAIPAPGSEFTGWVVEGAEAEVGGCGTSSSCLPLNFEEETEITVTATFIAVPPPAVTQIAPVKGPPTGGTLVTIEGTNLANASKVEFGSTAVSCPSAVAPNKCTLVSPTKIEVESPAHVPGTVDVTVTTAGGTSPTSAADHFTYITPPAVTSISPVRGPLGGGTLVTIEGTDLDNASKVEFGATAVSCPSAVAPNKCTLVSPTKIEVESPAHVAGAVDVTVTTPGGKSPAVPADQFNFVNPPTLTHLAPSEGPTAGGTLVTIEGTDLDNASKVEFGATAVSCPSVVTHSKCTLVSPTKIEVESPARAAGVVDVTVTTTGGTTPVVLADQFTYGAPPAVTALSPAKGPTAGGTVVVITGLRLGGASKVEFGSTAVSAGEFLENTATTIRLAAPAGAPGAVHVIVTTIGGASSKFPADEYTYLGPQGLTIAKAGSGSGSVTCNGGACAPSYAYGATVTLAAGADAGSSFSGFSGGGCSGVGPCTLTLEAATTVTATFAKNEEQKPPPPPEAKCTVPKLAKKSLAQAKSALKAANCGVGKVTKPKKSKGALVVKSSSPGAKKTLPAGSKVDLKLGPKPKSKQK